MLELDARPLLAIGDEPHLDLAGTFGIGLELPPRTDVPGEDEPIGRLIDEHASPAAFAAVYSPVDDVPASPRLEYNFGDLDGEQVVLMRLDPVELLGEDAERARSARRR
jgi:hypothetical protein